jgi:hypothetical protein
MTKLGMTLNATELKRMFPRCSKSFLEVNAAGVSDAKPKQIAPRALDGGLPGKGESAQRARLRITRCARRLLDQDNLYGGAKPLIDCLKSSGLIEDDSPEHIELIVRQERVESIDEERTEIEIETI